jgi:MFS superfamily sulfate permease-like transporter
MNLSRKNLLVFGYGLALILAVAAGRAGVKHGWGWGPAALLALALVFAGITLRDPCRLEKFYENWMKAAHVLGTIISTVVLTLLFYLVFGVAGCCLRLLRRDPLERKRDPGRGSYWVRREQPAPAPEEFLRQF